jgi:hypothetical protein
LAVKVVEGSIEQKKGASSGSAGENEDRDKPIEPMTDVLVQ